MKHLTYFLTLIVITITQLGTAQTKKVVDPFEKVIISPHIQTTFIEGTEESVIIEESTEPEDKINIEVNNNILRVYLDDAKETTKHKTITINGVKRQVPIYKGKVLTVTITYKNLRALSIRGEQSTLCKSKMKADAFKLKIYGESSVVFNHVQFQNFDVSVYGESTLNIKNGIIDYQKITAFGEGIIDLINVDNKTSKLKAFGEAQFKIQASDLIKLTAFGEAVLQYKGNASVKKGLNIGDVEISYID
ncbi:GIN domain-containing protein [Aquimarina sp. 2201CG14-23]|uniref:GIN domain-containing protein n=1 Tax=Aquimarina mycalae TaxID=3040073 RepID=UPI00247828F5|nr:DUF2807 domain-containing protein [Aquimarina sp. 2201CG14-23]MDH7448138.1 DUF2807 domain-containing protein [Aquimarina sp. 2201CG14-23]